MRRRLLALAEEDGDVAAAAITGSEAAGKADEWSDIDLAFSIRGDLSAALERWTEVLYGQFAAIQHWDLPWGSTVYRVFLLPDWLEVDIAFTRSRDFGPRGPNWRTVFGETVEVEPTAPPEPGQLAGLAWHHALHARICIERGQALQAEWLIGGLREHVLALACVRFGYPARFAKGADLLPPEVIARLEATLVRSLDEPELRRALAAASAVYVDELERSDAALAGRLRPMLAELSGSARSPRGR